MGIIEFTRVNFGPKNNPSWYQQLMAGVVLAGIIYLICEIYVDDCIAYGATRTTFLANLRKVFERVRKFKFALKPKKCRLGLFETEYVGRVININGTTMRNKTITKVLNFPLPIWFK